MHLCHFAHREGHSLTFAGPKGSSWISQQVLGKRGFCSLDFSPLWRTKNSGEKQKTASEPEEVSKLLENSQNCCQAMKVFSLLYLLLLLAASAAPVFSARPDFLNLRRKYHRHHCPHRRCMPLHSRVPFP